MADASAITDAQIERASAGDSDAMDVLMQQVSPQVYRMAVARLGPRSDQWHAVDEIVQESLLALTAGLPSLERRTVGGFRAYLSRIVENKVVDRIRREGKPGRHTGSLKSLNSTVAHVSSAGQFGQFLSASGLDPRTEVAQQEQVQDMLIHLSQLKPEHQQVITLSLFDQLKTAEIAQRMNISRPAASMLLIRAIDALRRRMQGSMSETEDGHGA
jgi:RNA polymerase sigma factor (sigma-70 family)